MRLLHKSTLKLSWHLLPNAPPYIVLSHRWRGTETSIQAFQAQRHLPTDQQSPGTQKILRLCREIESHSAEYVWVDTCCINKESSMELQEAINSMYAWYEHASLCLVYLDDVDSRKSGFVEEQLKASEWFTRGWTLQELLAPRDEQFLDVHWQPIGTREELGKTIEEITSIRPACFGNRKNIHAATVAERMSWMSGRQTTRVEDVAYCLLGVFDVNMGMLYGEGGKAFARLQREIINEIDDETIFLWLPTCDADLTATVPMLAPSPANFAVCRNHSIAREEFFPRMPYTMTKKGLHIEVYGYRGNQFISDHQNVLLNCTVDGCAVWLEAQRASVEDTRWRRQRDTKFILSRKGVRPPVPSPAAEYEREREKFMGGGLHPDFQAPHWGVQQMQWNNEVIRWSIFIE